MEQSIFYFFLELITYVCSICVICSSLNKFPPVSANLSQRNAYFFNNPGLTKICNTLNSDTFSFSDIVSGLLIMPILDVITFKDLFCKIIINTLMMLIQL
jgi:hypothetical protein